MKKIEIYDPAMCCPTGVCGPSVDPKLVQFAADLEWLKEKGVDVERYNLAQQPGAFAQNEIVHAELAAKGNACLPLIIIEGVNVVSGSYPTQKELAELAGVAFDPACEEVAVPAPGLTLPMADTADDCCPAPNDAPPIEADGEFCPWPRKQNRGCC